MERIRTRKLGSTGPSVGAIGLGCMGMSEFYGPSEDRKSIAVIHRALDLGLNLLDTADVYGSGANEKLLAQALKGKRDRAVVATKFGNVRAADGRFVGVDGKPDYVKRACDASLQRLGIETIDLYYQHRVDPDTPIEDTVGATRQGPLPRPVRGRSGHHSAGARGASHHGAPDGVLALVPRAGGRAARSV
jgi:aryl-alcohol dehydrogenase-like predicted oxidoreductase